MNVTQAEMMQVNNNAIGSLPQFGGVRGGKIKSENRVIERSPEHFYAEDDDSDRLRLSRNNHSSNLMMG